MPCCHWPSVGDAVLMTSADTSSSHDVAAAITSPSALMMMSLPWIIIVFSFLYYAVEMPAGVY
jgi:hypothetical protein